MNLSIKCINNFLYLSIELLYLDLIIYKVNY